MGSGRQTSGLGNVATAECIAELEPGVGKVCVRFLTMLWFGWLGRICCPVVWVWLPFGR